MLNRVTKGNALVGSINGVSSANLAKLSALGAAVASGTAVAKITDASVAHALNATFSDTEVETALNALGTKINLIIDALEAYSISASS